MFIPESKLLPIASGSAVLITCRGSGELIWSSSSGAAIPIFDVSSTNEIYQRHDINASTQDLTITNFGINYQNEYTCSTGNAVIAENIYLANCKFLSTNYNFNYLLFYTLYLALAVYILPSTVYTSQGTDANITATFHTPGGITATIFWFFNGMQINTSSSKSYSTVQIQSSEILRVANIDTNVLGNYKVVIFAEGVNQSDTSTLSYPGIF